MNKNKTDKQAVKKSKRNIRVWLIWIFLSIIIVFVALFAFGVLKPPAFIESFFNGDKAVAAPKKSANIAPQSDATSPQKAISQGEYALALAEMNIPNSYYLNYKVTLSSSIGNDVTDYIAIKRDNDWWVQTSKDGVILSTCICTDGTVKITDNASNSSVTSPAYDDKTPNGISMKEKSSLMPLSELVRIIKAVDSGESVSYGGGIETYSLSYTQSRLTSENIFSFSFTCKNGVSEEYIFSFERAVITSATKKYGNEIIYQMELKDSRNDLTDINIDELLKIN